MDKIKHSSTKPDCQRRGIRSCKPKKKVPINLLKKARREQRQRNEQPNRKRRRKRKRKNDFKDSEHEALVQATEAELKKILSRNVVLSDITYDCTLHELQGEIALAEGNGMIIYVERDDLSTLTIVLPQEKPTIANLKRAIESTARVQLKRELQQRHEERIRRRAREPATATSQQTESDCDNKQYNTPVKKQSNAKTCTLPPESRILNTGELVCSTTRNGHQHRANVSWRFLWRAYMLFHVDTNQPIDDSNGRRLLSDCGIENATTLKFSKREKYFGRKRQ